MVHFRDFGIRVRSVWALRGSTFPTLWPGVGHRWRLRIRGRGGQGDIWVVLICSQENSAIIRRGRGVIGWTRVGFDVPVITQIAKPSKGTDKRHKKK